MSNVRNLFDPADKVENRNVTAFQAEDSEIESASLDDYWKSVLERNQEVKEKALKLRAEKNAQTSQSYGLKVRKK